jgi:hypothetical protein
MTDTINDPRVCVDVHTLADARIHRELGDCVHVVGLGYRLHRVRCGEMMDRLNAEWRANGRRIGDA